jgi:predicted phage terminase large subunit-like protein
MTTNKFYATVRMYKLKATVMIDKIIALYINLSKEQKPIKIAIETVQFQEFFKDILEQRTQSIGLYLPIVPIKNTTNKELRIDALSPLINNQTILIDKNSYTFIEELETYPKSAHDDGLDSLEMAYKIAKKPAFSYQEAYKNLKLKESETSRLNRFLPQRQPNV